MRAAAEHGGAMALAMPAGARVVVARDPLPCDAPPDSPVAREWARQCEGNPRLYNAGILASVSVDAERGEVFARRDLYQRLVVQPRVATGVRLLSVTGVVLARDERGREHVLLGRRGPGVRLYPGLWELAPSGGLPAPPATVATFGESDLAHHLADEAREELGLELPPGQASVVAVVRDHAARSDDLCLRVHAGIVRDIPPANWEYGSVRWHPVDQIASLDAREGDTIINAARALFRLLGWV